jgi:hypothetical protein
MRKLGVALFLFMSVYAVAGRSRKDIPPAPLPLVVVNAKKVFLTNGGGSDLAYDTFYSEMKNWGKYEIVGSPDNADLIIEIFLSRGARRNPRMEHKQHIQRNDSST